MQESAPVGFDPMYERQLPWSTRLFVMYLFVVLLVSCFRAVRLVWDLRSLRKAGREATAQLNSGFWSAWDSCHARTALIRNWSALTFLLSFLVSAWSLTGMLRGISVQRVTGAAFLTGATAEVLMTFCLVRPLRLCRPLCFRILVRDPAAPLQIAATLAR